MHEKIYNLYQEEVVNQFKMYNIKIQQVQSNAVFTTSDEQLTTFCRVKTEYVQVFVLIHGSDGANAAREALRLDTSIDLFSKEVIR